MAILKVHQGNLSLLQSYLFNGAVYRGNISDLIEGQQMGTMGSCWQCQQGLENVQQLIFISTAGSLYKGLPVCFQYILLVLVLVF